jgi:hypothetical protein
MLPDAWGADAHKRKEERAGRNLADARSGGATLDEVVTRTNISDLKRRERAFEGLEHAEEKLRDVDRYYSTLACCNLRMTRTSFLNKLHEYPSKHVDGLYGHDDCVHKGGSSPSWCRESCVEERSVTTPVRIDSCSFCCS